MCNAKPTFSDNILSIELNCSKRNFSLRRTQSQRAKRKELEIEFPSVQSKRFALCAMRYATFTAENAAHRKKVHSEMNIKGWIDIERPFLY